MGSGSITAMDASVVVTIAAGPDIADLYGSVADIAREAGIDTCDSVEVVTETTGSRHLTARVARWLGQVAGSQAVPYAARGTEELTVRKAARSLLASRDRDRQPTSW